MHAGGRARRARARRRRRRVAKPFFSANRGGASTHQPAATSVAFVGNCQKVSFRGNPSRSLPRARRPRRAGPPEPNPWSRARAPPRDRRALLPADPTPRAPPRLFGDASLPRRAFHVEAVHTARPFSTRRCALRASRSRSCRSFRCASRAWAITTPAPRRRRRRRRATCSRSASRTTPAGTSTRGPVWTRARRAARRTSPTPAAAPRFTAPRWTTCHFCAARWRTRTRCSRARTRSS